MTLKSHICNTNCTQIISSLTWEYNCHCHCHNGLNITIYYWYIDRSVLLENTPHVKFIRNYIREPNGVFSISSLVSILMTSFPALSRSFVQTVSEKWRVIDLSIIYNKSK